MHKIYGKAVLTIIAAHGEDAYAGLPGVRTGTRRGTLSTLDLEHIQISSRTYVRMFTTDLNIGLKENYLSNCKYLTRAWTFQKSFLSTQTLIFTQKQVYWECATRTWCEETHWESSTLNFVGQRAIKDRTPEDIWEDNFDREAYDILSPDDEKKPEVKSNPYPTLVKEYTLRELSYDGDVLNGFVGVLNLMKERERSGFFFALRERYFGTDLLFNRSGVISRRFPGQTG